MTETSSFTYWNGSIEQCRALQESLRARVVLTPCNRHFTTIGGADISFNPNSNIVYAAIVVLNSRSLAVIDQVTITDTATFPYIPGYLSFREVPSLLKAWSGLTHKPEVMMLDGHGILHPRRLGVATHFGLETGIPTLGCAKKRLVGEYLEPGPNRGECSPIYYQQEHCGYVYRSRSQVKPIYISPGNGMSVDDALAVTKQVGGNYRLPEPTRLAHQLANQLRQRV